MPPTASTLRCCWPSGRTGEVTIENGRAVRTFVVDAVDKEIEIAPGVIFPGWTYNGRIPARRCARKRASA